MGATHTRVPTMLLAVATVSKNTSSSATEWQSRIVSSTVTLLRDTLSMAISYSSIVSPVFIRYAVKYFCVHAAPNVSPAVDYVSPCKLRRHGFVLELTWPIGQSASMALLPVERVRMQPIQRR